MKKENNKGKSNATSCPSDPNVLSPPEAIKGNSEENTGPRGKLLVIDDDEEVRSLLKDLLEESYYQVDTASSGEEALKMVQIATYDLVVTDLMMKGMHGLEVLKEVKAIDPSVDVIVMTGFASIDSAVESMKAGAADYITKPFNSDHIKLVIDKNIERRHFQRLASEREFYKVLSSVDELTELYNYRYFHQYLQKELERGKRYNRPLSLIMLDIDDFKNYNDHYGHTVGDEVLKKLSATLRNTTRGCDVVCRYGGEEFAIVLPETSKQKAAILCERIRKAVAHTSLTDENGNAIEKITITAGIASFPQDATTKNELIEMTDKALYQGKRAGKNCTFLYGAKGKYQREKKKRTDGTRRK